MEILTDFLCFEQTTFDVAYVTEIDPLWQDSALTSIINRPSPEPHPRTRRGMQQGLPQVSAL